MRAGMLEGRFLDLLDHFHDIEEEWSKGDRDFADFLDSVAEAAEEVRHFEERDEGAVGEEKEAAKLRNRVPLIDSARVAWRIQGEASAASTVAALPNQARAAYSSLPPRLDVPPPGGPLVRNLSGPGADLQSIVNVFFSDDFFLFPLPTILVDASQQGFPIIACNREFCRFSGYSAQEVCGRPCFFMADAMLGEMLDEEAGMTWNCASPTALRSRHCTAQGIEGRSGWTCSPGKMTGTIKVRRKSGELLQVFLDMRQIELDNQSVVIGIEVEMADTFANDNREPGVEFTPRGLDAGMAKLEQLLAAHYWYSSPLRRQQISAAQPAA